MKWSRENDFDAFISYEAILNGLDPSLIKSIIGEESGFNPAAIHQDAQGNFSAGLMQVENTTFAALGYDGAQGDAASLTGMWDPQTNIHFGSMQLANVLNALGNIPDAISAYNGGIRPQLGFGGTVAKPTTICLQRNPDGSCKTTRTAQPGEYGNQDYVVKVLSYLTYFRQQAANPPAAGGGGPLIPGASVTFTPSLLTIGLIVGILWWVLSPKGRG